MPWSPASWQAKPAAQQPAYPDAAALRSALEQLAKLPPLVSSYEIESLKSQLADAAMGGRFLLQGGDCAESFDDCESGIIANKLKILLQMSLVLTHGLRKRIIRVGRFAGQYAKPRSNVIESRIVARDGADLAISPSGDLAIDVQWPDGKMAKSPNHAISLPAYRGDLINRAEFTPQARTPDPQLMLRGYERAALTLNFIRALIDGGFADLHHPENWNLEFVSSPQLDSRAAEYQQIVEDVGRSLRLAETLAGQPSAELAHVEFFTSHEGLHLLYEQAQTRQVPRREGWYNLATHFPWIGMRTADVGGAHVEYFRGIRNPIAVKIGPVPPAGCASIADHITHLLDILHPENEAGHFTIIHRFGAREISRCLPELIKAVNATGKTVLWCCDPMHGNTELFKASSDDSENQRIDIAQKRRVANPLVSGSAGGTTALQAPPPKASALKIRKFDNIVAELQQAIDIHQRMGTYLGGLHIELTGDDVVECAMNDDSSRQALNSQVDPRLNYEQCLELAMKIAKSGT